MNQSKRAVAYIQGLPTIIINKKAIVCHKKHPLALLFVAIPFSLTNKQHMPLPRKVAELDAIFTSTIFFLF